jgi:hypothetical protein
VAATNGGRQRSVCRAAEGGHLNRRLGTLGEAVCERPIMTWACRAYSPCTHARKEEDGLLLEFPCNPTRTRSV